MDNEQIASHSEDVQETPTHDAFAEFGITPTVVEEPTEEELPETTTEEEPPAIETTSKKIVVKVDKQDREVPEEEFEERIQMSFGLQKERERREKFESALTRAAKLAGYDKVDDYLSNIDAIEQQAIQHKSNQLAELKQSMLDEYEGLGYDPSQLDAFIEKNPLFQQAKEIVAREQSAQEAQKAQEAEQAKLQGWQDLFTKYPTLAESMSEDGKADWYTPELEAKVSRGYDPIDAYELVNRDTILQSQRQLAEQAVITQQRLNKRAPLSADPLPTPDTEVPASIKQAFLDFDMDPKEAKKFYKK